MYPVLRNHGVVTLRKFPDGFIKRVAETTQEIYGESHPVTAEYWDVVEKFYNNNVAYTTIGQVYSLPRECMALDAPQNQPG